MLASVARAPSRFSLRIAVMLRRDSMPLSVTRVPGKVELFELRQPGEMLQPFVGDHGVAQDQPPQFLQPRQAFHGRYR